MKTSTLHGISPKHSLQIISFVVFLLVPAAVSASVTIGPLGSASLANTPSTLAVQNTYAYVATGSGLQIFNISNPAAPTLAGSMSTGYEITGVFVSGSYAYLAATSGFNHLIEIYNVSNPATPMLESSVTNLNQGTVFVSGNYLYLMYPAGDLYIFNVSNPASPTDVSVVRITEPADAIAVQGNYAYIETEYSLQIYNVSNPAAPTLESAVSIPGAAGENSFVVSGNYAYLTTNTGNNDLQTYNVSNPAAPILTGSVEFGSGTGGSMLSLSGTDAYVVSENDRPNFLVYDVSNPASPVLVGTTTVENSPSVYPIALSVQNNANAYIANYGDTLATYGISFSPSCSVALSPNPSAYSYSGTPVTLTWNSSNADEVYINNIGWVGTSGSTQVASQSTTNYSCYGYSSTYGAGSWDATDTTLTVNPSPSPTATISASSAAIYAGQPTNLFATFAAGSGDELTADNIDSPVGTGLGADANPDPAKAISFSTTTPGTYTFYARATTEYFPSWATLASTTVTVTANPQCTLSLSPTTVSQGQSAALSYSSSNATSFSINQGVGSESPNTLGQVQVSPSESTSYTGAVSAGNVQSTCSATLNVSCEESWSCNGQTIIQTNTDCSTTNLTTCVSPEFCGSGSESCFAPAITENPTGSDGSAKTGNLQIVPNPVHAGNSVQIYWNISDAQSCTVTGTDGDSWTGLSSPADGETSKPIDAQTTYTLFCEAYGNDTNLSETQSVNMAPTYEEI